MSKILIIEDNMDIAGLLSDLLKKEGYDVTVCFDGVQGREKIWKIKPNLVLLDLMLPGGGGFYVLEKLKICSFAQAIPVVVLTASRDKAHREKAQTYDIAAYVEKPYDNKQLLTIIRGVISK